MMPEERRNPSAAGNAISTFVNHPELTRSYLAFSFYLLTRSTLAPRLRELAVLRIAHLTSCAYEWDEHVVIGKNAGLSEDDIAALQAAARPPTSSIARCSRRSTNSSRRPASPTTTWAALGEQLDKRQLMDFVFTVGGYHMLAMASEHLWRRTRTVESTEEN